MIYFVCNLGSGMLVVLVLKAGILGWGNLLDSWKEIPRFWRRGLLSSSEFNLLSSSESSSPSITGRSKKC